MCKWPIVLPQYTTEVWKDLIASLEKKLYSKKTLLSNTIMEIRVDLVVETQKHNDYRLHHGLKGLTPMEYSESQTRGRCMSLKLAEPIAGGNYT